MSSRWEEFYASLAIPTDFEENKNKIKDFCEHVSSQQKIVLVTSGGTTVPLEHNTVRFVDNFSAGTRGSASAEYFLEKGYVVIFVHRLKSLEPYVRHFMGQKFLDMLEIHNDEAETSVVAACECLAPFGARAVLYLAAAVSDFYIPSSQMPTHKMQSEAGAPNISLQLVPKILEPLVNTWVPHAYVVSFKLETDENLLITRARGALSKYKHKMVIANILHTRKYRVVLVMATTCSEIVLDPEEIEAGIEIESKIVSELTKRHESFIAESV
ncbi:hypothetical protein ANN_01838 [Periplaneta americana]|uniref:DNA/pantothenate metabolism flavoprotein C-terminal domain-containing protein n=1 Tax=Periplaneta americana TaxID=6978 RepID=A0ABQ8TUQ4_PERAM|nr:hypothetical protein ANN_01838 [Periplaneta americana]